MTGIAVKRRCSERNASPRSRPSKRPTAPIDAGLKSGAWKRAHGPKGAGSRRRKGRWCFTEVYMTISKALSRLEKVPSPHPGFNPGKAAEERGGPCFCWARAASTSTPARWPLPALMRAFRSTPCAPKCTAPGRRRLAARSGGWAAVRGHILRKALSEAHTGQPSSARDRRRRWVLHLDPVRRSTGAISAIPVL